MTPQSVRVVVVVEHLPGTRLLFENVPPDDPVGLLIQTVLRRLGLPVVERDWRLYYQGSPLPSDHGVRLLLALEDRPLELILRRAEAMPPPARPAPPRAPAAPADDSFADLDLAPPAPAEGPASGCALGEEGAAAESSAFELTLDESSGVRARDEEEEADAATMAPAPMPPGMAPRPAATDDEDLDISADEEAAGEDEEEAAAPAPRKRETATRAGGPQRATVTRRATVRYYSRMNPERVFPLLVLITRQMVETVRKRHVDQKTSAPFRAAADLPVEIEPILPGCDCHPPRITARLDGDLTATFRVVPRVLGRVEGASVVIRQDHVVLAEIALDVKVAKRTLVVLSGMTTFALPGLSAVMKHFGLDFASQKESGFNLYLSAANLIFDRMTPLALTLGLGLVTGLLWWLTRPRQRDVFWDIEKVGPGEKLRRIAATAQSDQGRASRELAELLGAFPDYQPARLFAADWHYNLGDFEAALRAYEAAFELGPADPQRYLRASLAASRLGRHAVALRILQTADRLLPAGRMHGVMLFNMACYHTRLGNADLAMKCLRRAVAAGYRKPEQYRKDPDLNPLRGRPDFKQLVAELARA